MSLPQSFFRSAESELSEAFLDRGFVIRQVTDRPLLDEMRHAIVAIICGLLNRPLPSDEGAFLDSFHNVVPIAELNALRLAVYRKVNEQPWFRPTYFTLARPLIENLVGNELAMQNRINFSIQMPEDLTSLLDIHADVFSGETPYQVVQWLPLVDVTRTKSMFILPRSKSLPVVDRMKDFAVGGMKALYDAVEPDLEWLTIPYGNVLIFSPNCLHGNVVNREPGTRWSLNARFTGLFTPYYSAEKALGSFYLPITIRPVTRVGMTYREPSGFEE